MNVQKAVTLKEGEDVLAIERNHWIMRLGAYFVAVLLVAAPMFGMIPLFDYGKPGLIFFALCVLTGIFIGSRAAYLSYWNAFIITSKRVIDIDQRGFFRRTVSEAAYDKIQDVSFSVDGIIPALFGYGSLIIQTAGGTTNLELPNAKNPKVVYHLITETMAAARGSSIGDGGRSGKVTQLLEAASSLNDAEARAFLVAIQQAVGRKDGPKPAPTDQDLAWYKDDEKGQNYAEKP